MRTPHNLIEGYVYEKLTGQKIFGTKSNPIKDFAKLTPHQLMIRIAKAMVGIHEEGGNNSGKLVTSIQRTVGIAEREAWCMSTVQTIVALTEKWKGMICNLPISEHCQTVFNKANELGLVVHNPIVADICIWQKFSNGKALPNGHTGIVVVDGDTVITTIEGNTGNQSGVQSDGDGIYKKNRDTKGYGNMHMRGFIRVSFSQNPNIKDDE